VHRRYPGPRARQTRVSRRQVHLAREQLAVGGLSQQERRRLRSVMRTWDASAHRRRLEFRHVAFAFAGAMAAMAVAAASVGLGSAIDAARGQGAKGTFVLGFQSCSVRTGCTWVGTFRSPDGSTVPDVAYDGTLPAGASPGSSFPALEPGGSGYVYPPHGSLRWVSDLLFMMLIGGAVGFILWLSPLGMRGPDAAGIGIGIG
jgi:hypothetical protein